MDVGKEFLIKRRKKKEERRDKKVASWRKKKRKKNMLRSRRVSFPPKIVSRTKSKKPTEPVLDLKVGCKIRMIIIFVDA